MRLKTDWIAHLQKIRRQEFELIFERFPSKAFPAGLELGAGDGYQSKLMEPYVRSLVSTDFQRPPLTDKTGSVIFRACDAEEIGQNFGASEFDLVYSSNLLEHLPDPGSALRGAHKVLRDDGITIHVVPSPTWKLFHLLLYPVHLFARTLEVISERVRPQESRQDHEAVHVSAFQVLNPKTTRRRRSRLNRLLIPEPHGVSPSNFSEFHAFSKGRWKRELGLASFDVLAVLKGPLASGYGFGFDSLRNSLRKLGLCSEYIYVAKKAGKTSRYEKYFLH